MTRLPDGREIDVEAIRARDAENYHSSPYPLVDRRDLVALVDALRQGLKSVLCTDPECDICVPLWDLLK